MRMWKKVDLWFWKVAQLFYISTIEKINWKFLLTPNPEKNERGGIQKKK